MKREVSVREAAKMAELSGRHIRRLLQDGKIKGRQINDWLWLVDVESLEAWIEQSKERAHD
jgi:excisionase family DNA binding protein